MSASTDHGVIHWARLYDLGSAISRGRTAWLQRAILEAAAPKPGERVLDIGCGPGRLTLAGARAVGSSGVAAGVDPSPEMIALAKRKASRASSAASFQVAPMEALPFPNGSFDAVLASLVLHHVAPDLLPRALAEASRVLAPGGRLVALEFTSHHGLVGRLRNKLGGCHGVLSAEAAIGQLRAAGFEAARVEPAGAGYCLFLARNAMPSAAATPPAPTHAGSPAFTAPAGARAPR